MKISRIAALVALTLVLGACAQAIPLPDAVAPANDQAGFWFGLWNGFTVPFAFIGSLFDNDIAIYSVNNNGGWYDFGFALGVGAFTGSASRT
jgi:hypothetical protein